METMMGITQDPHVGPLIAFGLGGIHVEILGDVRFRIAPLTDRDVDELLLGSSNYVHVLQAGEAGKMTAKDMTMFRTILCPVDFSASSRSALSHAASIAHGSGGEVTVLFVNDPLLATAAAAAAYDTEAMARRTDAELKSFVRRALTGFRLPGRAVHFACTPGKPAQEIVKVARKINADLIVMGTRGLSGASRLMLGSVTEHVLRSAAVPVLAVPPGAKAPTGRRPIRRRLR